MDEKQVLELMRDVTREAYGDDSELADTIDRRLAALPAYEFKNEEGLKTRTHEEFMAKRDEIRRAALPAAAQADGEPTIEECTTVYRAACTFAEQDRNNSNSAIVRKGIAAVRSLMLRARPAPSHALVEAADAMRATLGKPWEFNHGHPNKLPEECPVCQAFRAYDLARASLPAAKKDGGA